MSEIEKIYCIGDSHVSFFSGQEAIAPLWPNRAEAKISGFEVFRLGAVLAYSLSRNGTRMNGREKLFEILSFLPKGSKVLLLFGEIDCRVHLLKIATKSSTPIEQVVKRTVEAYYSVVQEVIEAGFNVIVWGVMPSSGYDTIKNKDYPAYGTSGERNRVTRKFNEELKGKCENDGVPFVDFFECLLDKRDRTKMFYYMDETHLSQVAMKKALSALENEVSGLKIKTSLSYKKQYCLIFLKKIIERGLCFYVKRKEKYLNS